MCTSNQPSNQGTGVSRGDPGVLFATEAIAVVDIVGATERSVRYGWNTVGRELMRDLRELINSIEKQYGIKCRKSTGDGYLLAYRNSQSADLGAVNAVKASFDLLDRLKNRNQNSPEQQVLNVRFAIHFGEVDVVEGDREGLNVSYTFRLESIDREKVKEAMNAMPSEDFPLENYGLCSEQVAEIIKERCPNFCTSLVGLFKLKGFPGHGEVYLVSRKSKRQSNPQ